MRAIICSVLLLSAAPYAHAQESPEIRAAARATAKNGMDAYNDGDFVKAEDYFERAEKLVHAPPHLLYIARSRLKLGRLVAAREAYLELERENLAADAPAVFVQAKTDAAKELDELEPRIPYVSVVVQGGGANVSVYRNGQQIPAPLIGVPQPIDPGQHEFAAKGDGLMSSSQSLTLSEGAKETVLLTLRPDPNAPVREQDNDSSHGSAGTKQDGSAGNGLKIAGYASLGVGVIGAGLGTFFLVKGAGELSDADTMFAEFPGCAQSGCTSDQQEEVDAISALDRSGTKKQGIGVASLAVGGAALITGTVLLIIAPRKAQSQSAGIRPWFGGQTVGLTGSF